MEFFDSSKSIIENISLLSGTLIFLVTLVGLWQIVLTKKSMRISSQRDAAKLSLELCEKFNQEMNSKVSNTLYQEFKSNNLDFDFISDSNNVLSSIDEKEIKNTLGNYYEIMKNLNGKLNYHLQDVADSLECLAIPIINKIADEQIAYHFAGYPFVQCTKLCSYYIVARNNKNPETYENLISLYCLWNKRIAKNRIDKEIKRLQTAGKVIKDQKNIKPIGTD
ncbi:MAG: hypothetical protein K1X81_03025 [Bacteroidia bacterium]|nr:hypothetical protein [Bacteroidia bacterium]